MEIAIVTGASRGIGREIAKTLAKKGIKVIANYNRSEEKAQKLQQELKEQGIEIDIFKADVSKREEAKKLVEYTLKKYNNIEVFSSDFANIFLNVHCQCTRNLFFFLVIL